MIQKSILLLTIITFVAFRSIAAQSPKYLKVGYGVAHISGEIYPNIVANYVLSRGILIPELSQQIGAQMAYSSSDGARFLYHFDIGKVWRGQKFNFELFGGPSIVSTHDKKVALGGLFESSLGFNFNERWCLGTTLSYNLGTAARRDGLHLFVQYTISGVN